MMKLKWLHLPKITRLITLTSIDRTQSRARVRGLFHHRVATRRMDLLSDKVKGASRTGPLLRRYNIHSMNTTSKMLFGPSTLRVNTCYSQNNQIRLCLASI